MVLQQKLGRGHFLVRPDELDGAPVTRDNGRAEPGHGLDFDQPTLPILIFGELPNCLFRHRDSAPHVLEQVACFSNRFLGVARNTHRAVFPVDSDRRLPREFLCAANIVPILSDHEPDEFGINRELYAQPVRDFFLSRIQILPRQLLEYLHVLKLGLPLDHIREQRARELDLAGGLAKDEELGIVRARAADELALSSAASVGGGGGGVGWGGWVGGWVWGGG